MDSEKNIMKMENESQKKSDSPPIKNFQEIFLCDCGKQYKSFPALYLHNRKKHELNLKLFEKEFMPKKVVWSGKKKKIIYQLPDPKIIKEFQNSDDKLSTLKTKNAPQKKEPKLQFNNISTACQRYLTYIETNGRNQQTEFVRLILRELLKCLAENFDVIFDVRKLQANHKELDNCHLLPFALNYFVMTYVQQRQIEGLYFCPELINSLLYFSEWLHIEQYSENIVVPNQFFWKAFKGHHP